MALANPVIYGPNLLGLIFAVVQLTLAFIFPRKMTRNFSVKLEKNDSRVSISDKLLSYKSSVKSFFYGPEDGKEDMGENLYVKESGELEKNNVNDFEIDKKDFTTISDF